MRQFYMNVLIGLFIIGLFACDQEPQTGPCLNQALITKVAYLGPENQSVTWRTPNNASKNCHAQLTIVVNYDRNWDRDRAEYLSGYEYTPPITFEFGTVMGYFPAQLQIRREGVVEWTAYVNQAAQNEPGGEETQYHITVTYDMERAADLDYPRLVVEGWLGFYYAQSDNGSETNYK